MADTVVKLSRSYERPDGTSFDSVTLREPTYRDSHVDGLGVPAEFQPGPNGGMALYVYRTVVAEYINRLAKDPPAEYLGRLSVIDAMRLEKAVRDFFIEPEKPTASGTPPTG